jgi:uncharacterized membrane protein
MVLGLGVTGSALGRFLYSCYIQRLAVHFIRPEKNNDLRFIGARLGENSWKVQFFVVLYTLVPLPSTPLFTAAGVAGIRTISIIPSFLIGKFCSDAVMVFTSNRVLRDLGAITGGLLSLQTLAGTVLGLVLICLFLFTDWQKLLLVKKFRINFRIWK